MSTLRSQWQKNQAMLWLVCGVCLIFLSFIFWAFTEKDEVNLLHKEEDSAVKTMIQPEKVAATTYLGGLINEVKPLEKTVRIKAATTHEAQFRGTKFIGEQQGHYTIELFRANKEDVIKDFLRRQATHEGLIYIRLSGEEQPEQYVLLSGNFANELQAQSALDQLSLQLPPSVKPSIQSFANYQPYVNDLGSEEAQANSNLYAVKLKPVAIPITAYTRPLSVKPTTSSAALTPDSATTTTRITRKDAEGNVLDVQSSSTKAATTPSTSNSTTTQP